MNTGFRRIWIITKQREFFLFKSFVDKRPIFCMFLPYLVGLRFAQGNYLPTCGYNKPGDMKKGCTNILLV